MIETTNAPRLLLLVALLAALEGCGDDAGSGAGGGGGGDAGPGSVQVQISGEDAALDGFLFPTGSEVTIVDGWELHFDHVLVTVGRVWLSEDPNRNPGDQSDIGADVAEAVGPWVIDLTQPGDVPAAGGEGQAIHIADITQTLDGGPLSGGATYAFSFSLVPADANATAVNLNESGAAAYEDAVANGYAVYYVGTATFKGDTCTVSDDTYDFTAIPATIPFQLGFDTPTNYLNCQNQENQGDPYQGEEYPRGIAIKESSAALGQITIHLEHPVYSDVQHEPPVFFDAMGAQLVGEPAETPLTMELLEGVDVTAITDASGADLPWRSCDGSDIPASPTRAYETGTIPVGPDLDPESGFRDYRDFVRYVQSTQGHLNGGEGLCYIDRQYPSPP